MYVAEFICLKSGGPADRVVGRISRTPKVYMAHRFLSYLQIPFCIFENSLMNKI